jgi:hypothetical protein
MPSGHCLLAIHLLVGHVTDGTEVWVIQVVLLCFLSKVMGPDWGDRIYIKE